MRPWRPRLRDQSERVYPAADNDNLPEELRPRTLRKVKRVIEEPVVFFLYLLMAGLVCTLGYSIALSIAIGLN